MPFTSNALAGGYFESVFSRRVVDGAFAHELHLAVSIAAVEAHPARRQRHAEVVRLAVLDFFNHHHLGVLIVETVAAILVHVAAIDRLNLPIEPIVGVGAMHGDVGRVDELYLLGLTIAQGDGTVEVVEVEVVKGFSCVT